MHFSFLWLIIRNKTLTNNCGSVCLSTQTSHPTKEIEDITKSLKAKNSQDVKTEVLNISYPSTTSPLRYFCNTKGMYPDRLRFSLLQPLYKIGSKLDMTNYIPTSLSTAL
jgi:hypothetical protein